MKASKKRIRVYKAYVLEPIVERNNALVENGYDVLGWGEVTKEQADSYIKQEAQLKKSCIQMSSEELEEVIIMGRLLGDKLGLNLEDLPDELYSKIDMWE